MVKYMTVSICCHINMLGSVNHKCALLGYYAASNDNS